MLAVFAPSVAPAFSTAREVTSAAITPSTVISPGRPLPPVASANSVSPSVMVCTGRMQRASPSCAMVASLLAWALVSEASVAITPMVVAMPASARPGKSPRRIAATLSSAARPSAVRAPARMRPEAGSTTSPMAFTATRAPTVTLPMRSDALPMPPFMACAGPNSLPTVAPAPAPTLPWAGGSKLAALQAA